MTIGSVWGGPDLNAVPAVGKFKMLKKLPRAELARPTTPSHCEVLTCKIDLVPQGVVLTPRNRNERPAKQHSSFVSVLVSALTPSDSEFTKQTNKQTPRCP